MPEALQFTSDAEEEHYERQCRLQALAALHGWERCEACNGKGYRAGCDESFDERGSFASGGYHEEECDCCCGLRRVPRDPVHERNAERARQTLPAPANDVDDLSAEIPF